MMQPTQVGTNFFVVRTPSDYGLPQIVALCLTQQDAEKIAADHEGATIAQERWWLLMPQETIWLASTNQQVQGEQG